LYAVTNELLIGNKGYKNVEIQGQFFLKHFYLKELSIHSVFKTGKQRWHFITTNFGRPTFEVYQHDERLAKSVVCFGPTHRNARVLYGNFQNYRP